MSFLDLRYINDNYSRAFAFRPTPAEQPDIPKLVVDPVDSKELHTADEQGEAHIHGHEFFTDEQGNNGVQRRLPDYGIGQGPREDETASEDSNRLPLSSASSTGEPVSQKQKKRG